MYIYIFSIYILHIYVIDCKIQFTKCSIPQSLPFLNKFTTTKTNLAFCYNNCCWHDGQLTQTKKLKVIAVQQEMCPFFFLSRTHLSLVKALCLHYSECNATPSSSFREAADIASNLSSQADVRADYTGLESYWLPISHWQFAELPVSHFLPNPTPVSSEYIANLLINLLIKPPEITDYIIWFQYNC